jgi:hypothetical protein
MIFQLYFFVQKISDPVDTFVGGLKLISDKISIKLMLQKNELIHNESITSSE